MDGDGEWQDLIADEAAIPEQIVMEGHDSARRREWVREAMKVLRPRELEIITRRRLADEPMTLEALGHELGVSKERVRQIEMQAMMKLRRALEKLVGDPEESGLLPET